jgi:hypothetical protein
MVLLLLALEGQMDSSVMAMLGVPFYPSSYGMGGA